MTSHRATYPRQKTSDRKIFLTNLTYVRTFAANSGLMRCLLQFGDEEPEFAKLWYATNDKWTRRAVDSLSRDPDLKIKDRETLLLSMYSLGEMTDGLLRSLYIDRSPGALEAASRVATDHEALAEFLTTLWFRALYAADATDLPDKS